MISNRCGLLILARAQRRSVVEEGPQIPFAVPSRAFHRPRAEFAARSRHQRGKLLLAAARAYPGELVENVHEKPCQPDAFALPLSPTLLMPSFQSQEPIRGKP